MTLITNEFSAGMDQDSSKNKYDNRHYYAANNVRILTQDGSTSGALEDMAGTIERLDISNVNGTGGSIPVTIVGYTVLRDNIVMFITENVSGPPDPAANNDFIVLIPIVDIESLTGTDILVLDPDYLHNGGSWIYRNALGFSTDYPIQAVPRYETEYVQKVYWVDGYNKLRYINIVYDEDTNDLTSIPPDRLEVLGDFDLSKPTLKSFGTGNLKAGRIQYVYQLYALNGGETVFSPTSNLINLMPVYNYGGDLDENVNKSVTCEIEIESKWYTRIRVVAIHHSVLNLEPEIRIVREDDISPDGGTYQFIDTGESAGSYTLEEIRLLQTTLFSAAVIETKDNILFAGNVMIDDFDVDFDARAYRFGGNSSTSTDYNYCATVGIRRISHDYNIDGVNYYEITGSTKVTTLEPAGTPIGDWEDIPIDADVINNFNDLDNDGDHDYRFMFQSNGTTVGGEGPNVKYEFKMRDSYINTPFNTSWIKAHYEEGTVDNPGLAGYSSPWLAGKYLGYHRDEIYRFGIVFFDDKGRASFVKWIGDIRMPSFSTQYSNVAGEDFRHHSGVASGGGRDNTLGHILYPEFTVENVPDTVTSWQIVRVRRESNDRSVLGQGTGTNADLDAGSGEYRHIGWKDANSTDAAFQFVSPEISFNNNLLPVDGDQIQIIGSASSVADYAGFNTFGIAVTMYDAFVPLVNPQTPAGSAITGDEWFVRNYTPSRYAILVNQTDTVVAFPNIATTYNVNNDDATENTVKGRCLAFSIGLWDAEDLAYTAVKLLNYRRNVFDSQYGGPDYNARTVNEYIACSNIYEYAVGSTVVSDFGGDTYITLYEHLWRSRVHGKTLLQAPDAEIFTMPVESSINVEVQVTTRPADAKYVYDEDAAYLHDVAGVYADDDDLTLANLIFYQSDDIYIYNSAYSQENTVKIFIPKPFDWKAQTTIDTRVYASDLKINGEIADSWLRFRTDSFIEVDPQYGPLTVLKTMANQLIFFQPKAFGVLSVNERALLETGSISQLSLGTSGVLARYDYGKTNVGCSHWRHLILTPNAMYWVDVINQSMFQHTKGPEEISLLKGMNSWFRENIVERKDMTITIDGAMHLYYDPKYREVYVVDNTEHFGLVYNEMTQAFVTFTDNQPFYVVNYLDKVLGTSGSFHQFHRHNDFAGNRGQIYGNYREVSLTLLINPSVEDIGVFNNFEWLTESFIDNAIFGLQDQPITWQSVQMYNDYQNTGSITLTVGENVKRRMRKWRFIIPRSRYERGGILTQNHRYARMRDTHLFAKFAYLNDTADRRFTIHDITTSVTISNN